MGDRVLPAVPNRVSSLTTPPFPPAYANPLVTSDKLQAALTKAVEDGPGKNWRVGIALAALEQTGAHPFAHFKGDREFFGASMIKVAALYALFELRATLRAIAAELGTNATKATVLTEAQKYLDPLILAKADTLPALKGIRANRALALPEYSRTFKVEGSGPFTVEFSSEFAMALNPSGPRGKPTGHIEKMITVSDNGSAGRCVHACGYGYLNGALASAGLFEPDNGLGIWLGGDYSGTGRYFTVHSDNDQLVGQASTALHMVRLLALLRDKVLFGKSADSQKEVLRALVNAAEYPEVWIHRDMPLDFTVTHNKLGVAGLKSINDKGADVFSECSFLQHSSGKRFAVAWLNMIPVDRPQDLPMHNFNPVAKVVNDTINAYLTP